MVEPGKNPKVTTLQNDLDSLQKAVSIGADYQGLIEIVPLGNGDCILCNEEGKQIGLDGNRRVGRDIIVLVGYSDAKKAEKVFRWGNNLAIDCRSVEAAISTAKQYVG